MLIHQRHVAAILISATAAACSAFTMHAQGISETEAAMPVLGAATVAPGTPISVRTAVSTASGKIVTTGRVDFCIESDVNRELLSSPCGPFPLASAEVTKDGEAFSFIRLPVGNHKVVAVYAGTKMLRGSVSPSATASVSGVYASTTSLSYSGPITDLTIKASVTTPSHYILGSLAVRDLTSGQPLFSFAGPVTTHYKYSPFSKAQQIGSSPYGVGLGKGLSADLNNDGYPDLVYLDYDLYSPYTINNVVLQSNAKGNGFAPAVSGPPSYFPNTNDGFFNFLSVADINADGSQDLILGDANNPFLGVYYGKGDGTFPAAPSVVLPISSKSFTQAVVVADFDNDGTQDVGYCSITYKLNSQFQTVPDKVTFNVIPNHGDGTFGAPITTLLSLTTCNGSQVLLQPHSGHAGIAFTEQLNSGDFAIEVLAGNGDGTFARTTYAPGPVSCGYCAVPAALDLNQDGYQDIVVNFGEPSLVVLLGNSGGGYTPAPAIELPEPAMNMLQLPYGIIATDQAGHFTLVQFAASGVYPQANFFLKAHDPLADDSDNEQFLAAGDFRASGIDGFLLALTNGPVGGQDDSSNLKSFESIAATATSTMRIHESGFSFADPQTLLGRYHPGGNPAFAPSNSQEVVVPGTETK